MSWPLSEKLIVEVGDWYEYKKRMINPQDQI